MSSNEDIQMTDSSVSGTTQVANTPSVIDPNSQVQIRLVTRDTKYSVPDVPLYVPVSLRRYGLSEVVNKLLEQDHENRVAEGVEALLPGETEESGFVHIPFDFLADDGSLLRTASLAEYLSKRGLSSENALTLEYTRAVLPPSYLASYSHPDWVSAVDIFKHANTSLADQDDARVCDFSPIATGSYDGVIRLWTPSATVSHQLVAHNAAIKALKWTSPSTLVSASNDRMLCLWSLKPAEGSGDITANSSIVALLRGHTDAINDIAISSPGSASSSPLRILSASADKTLKLWSTDYKTLPQFEENESISAASKKNTASQKRRKLAMHKLPQARSRTALLTLSGHTQAVTGTVFHPNSAVHGASVAYSVGLDHTIKTWDLETGTQVSSKTSGFSLTAMTALASLGLLACGSSARHVLLHDPRDGNSSENTLSLLSSLDKDGDNASVSKATLVGHTNMVTSLAPSPHSQYVFVSGSLDGTSRVWDIRAQRSLYVIEREKGAGKAKTVGALNAVLGVDWSKDVGIVSAGKDNMLQINSSGETHV